MSQDTVSITDHLQEFSIERNILKEYFNEELTTNTTIALVWKKQINENFLTKYKNIRAVVRYGVGYDNIDMDLCKRKNIIVVNTPDYGIDEVADTALAMILNLTRKINSLQEFAKSDQNSWNGKKINFPIKRINKMSLGIIGLGRIGSSLARKYLSLSRIVGFYDPYISSGAEKILDIKRYEKLYDLLNNSDIVSIHTPLTEETNNLVNKDFISNMKKGSFLINVSRGCIIKDQNLIYESLKSNHLEGYATDVWTSEPPELSDKLYRVWKDNQELNGRVIINPHTAYYSNEALEEARVKASESCLDIINGKQCKNRII